MLLSSSLSGMFLSRVLLLRVGAGDGLLVEASGVASGAGAGRAGLDPGPRAEAGAGRAGLDPGPRAEAGAGSLVSA